MGVAYVQKYNCLLPTQKVKLQYKNLCVCACFHGLNWKLERSSLEYFLFCFFTGNVDSPKQSSTFPDLPVPYIFGTKLPVKKISGNDRPLVPNI